MVYKKYISDSIGNKVRHVKADELEIFNKKLTKQEVSKLRDFVLKKIKNMDYYHHNYGIKSIVKFI